MAFIKYVDKNIHSYIRMKAFIRTIKGIIIIPPSEGALLHIVN